VCGCGGEEEAVVVPCCVDGLCTDASLTCVRRRTAK